jgi:hypothetical protein
MDVLLNISLSHCVSQENHLEYHFVSTLYTEENDTPITWAPSPLSGVHIVSSQTTHPSHHPTQGHTHQHTHLMGIFTPHRGTQRSISVSERNDTSISWAHPTHGFSHRSTLSAREAFSTRPNLLQKYLTFVLASGLVKISSICSCVGRYCTCTSFLCAMSLI